ncbi:hypothetical protein ASC68_19370 [Devosia sp. Root105]|nr:hypothetical protein ASC68_19370 [Devosia sp. Root105]
MLLGWRVKSSDVKARLDVADDAAKREQRLAAKLRENLKRRKEQARTRAAGTGKSLPETEADSTADGAALKPLGDSDS